MDDRAGLASPIVVGHSPRGLLFHQRWHLFRNEFASGRTTCPGARELAPAQVRSRMTRRGIAITVGLIFVILVVSPPSWDALKLKYSQWQDERAEQWLRRRAERIRALNAMPLPRLPERPGDRARFPREGFRVTFDGTEFAIDTFSGVFYYGPRDTTIIVRLAKAQLDSLYEEALLDRLFEMQEPRFLGAERLGSVRYGGVLTLYWSHDERSFRWDAWDRDVLWSEDHKRLNSFVIRLGNMLESSPEMLALPRPTRWRID